MVTEGPFRVLVVDDCAEDREMVARFLGRLPGLALEILAVETVAAAEQALRGGQVDVALVDLNMPDSTGLDTVVSLIRHARGAAVIVLTGCADERVGAEAVAAGAHGCVVKDFDYADSDFESLLRGALSHGEGQG